MKSSSVVLTAVLATCSLAQEWVSRCGAPEPPETMKFSLNQAAFRGSSALFRNDSQRSIETYVHVVTTEAKDGLYTEEQIDAQMEAMNEAYAPAGISFDLIDVDFTADDDWAMAGQATQAELEMKTELRQGGYDALNLYFLSDLGGGLLGFCYFPVDDLTDEDLVLDGCINLAGTIPGTGEYPDYDLGLTAVHETGHWFGLFHVFQGSSCSGAGDYIADTPLQSQPTSGCPASSDTCPDQPGLDSIHNYMDYSYDECLDEFTRDQNSRMVTIFDTYRAGK